MAVAVKPSKSLLNIRSGIKSIKDSFFGLKKNSENLNEVMLKKTKVKRESIARNYILSQRRQEEERRKNREDLLEASSIGGAIKRQGKAIASSTKGFLGRIMDFLGTLLVGWLLTNLPSIITMAQELIARIQRLYTILTSSFDNTVKLFKGFGNLLSAVGKNILTVDFTDSKGRVESALKDLDGTFSDMQSQFDEGFKLLTTSLGEGVASGENAQPFGTQYENESMQEQPSEGVGGPETSGGRVSSQAVYSYLRSKGMSHNHALGITANIKGESDFEIGVGEKGDSRSGVGLFQYSNVRKPAFLRAVPDYKTNWKGQIDYAIGEGVSPQYFRTQFSSPEEAAYWWMDKWERPAARVYTERNKKHNDFIKSFKSSSNIQTKPKPAQPSTQIIQVPPGNINPTIGDRLGAGRGHGGVDLQVENGTPLRAISDGVIVDSDYEKGWGNFLVMKDDRGIYHLYGHMQSGYKRGGPVKKGEVIGKVGMTGRTSGPHLHWESGTGWNGGTITGRFDALSRYSKYAPFNTSPTSGVPAEIQRQQPTPAQIASSGTQQRRQASQQLAQQPAGPSVVIIEEDPPAPQPQVSAGGGVAMMIPIVINPLNSFITKKLLLDLAYT